MAQLQGGGGWSKRPPAVRAPSVTRRAPSYGTGGITATPRRSGSSSGGNQNRTPARPSSYSDGGSSRGQNRTPVNPGRYSGGGGMGSSPTGNVLRTPAPPKPMDINAFLGQDSTYQQQLSALQKAKSDYMAQQNNQKTQYTTGYAGDLDTLKKNRTSSMGDLENDYASRGLLQSGLYGDAMSDMSGDFDKRTSALEQAKAAFLSGLSGDFTNFSTEQELALAKAKQEAAARQAAGGI